MPFPYAQCSKVLSSYWNGARLLGLELCWTLVAGSRVEGGSVGCREKRNKARLYDRDDTDMFLNG
jgi:hypothetical protein